MAIQLEDDKKGINWVAVFTVLIILSAVGSAIFYIFFINPEQVEVFISPELRSLSDFEKISFKPNDLLSNASFQSLKSHVNFSLPSQEMIGKANPFSI